MMKPITIAEFKQRILLRTRPGIRYTALSGWAPMQSLQYSEEAKADHFDIIAFWIAFAIWTAGNIYDITCGTCAPLISEVALVIIYMISLKVHEDSKP